MILSDSRSHSSPRVDWPRFRTEKAQFQENGNGVVVLEENCNVLLSSLNAPESYNPWRLTLLKNFLSYFQPLPFASFLFLQYRDRRQDVALEMERN